MAAVFMASAVGNSACGVAHKKKKIQVVDGRSPFVPEGPTCQGFLVEAFMPDTSNLSCEQKQYLDSLGFRLSYVGGAGVTQTEIESTGVGGWRFQHRRLHC